MSTGPYSKNAQGGFAVNYSGDTFGTGRKKPSKYGKCQQPKCKNGTMLPNEYCWKHSGICVTCGDHVSANSTQCRACSNANPEMRRKRGEAITARFVEKGVKNIPKNPIDDLKDIIRCYEDYWIAGQHPSLCQDALPKLRANLAAMERCLTQGERDGR